RANAAGVVTAGAAAAHAARAAAALAAAAAGTAAGAATRATTGATAAGLAAAPIAAVVRSAPTTGAAPRTWRAASHHQSARGEEGRPGEGPKTISRQRLGRHGTPLVRAYIFSILNTLPSAYSEK